MKNFFFDTSAYLSLLLKDGPGWSMIYKSTKNEAYYCSSLLFTETQRTLVRLTRDQKIAPEQSALLFETLKKDVALFCYKEPTIDIVLDSVFPAILLPKTLDLLHLRTALWFKEKLANLIFVSLDYHQIQSARELNLDILEINS